MPGFKPSGKGGGGKDKGGGKGKLSGGHWATIGHHRVYLSGPPGHKGGKVLAGGYPGITHGKDGTPIGRAKPAGDHPSIPMHPGNADPLKKLHDARAAVRKSKKEVIGHARKVVEAKAAHDKAKADGKALADAHHTRQVAKAAKTSQHAKDYYATQKAEDAAHAGARLAGGTGKAGGPGGVTPRTSPTPSKHDELVKRHNESVAKTDAMIKDSIAYQREAHAGKVFAAKERAGKATPEKLSRPSHGQHPPAYKPPTPSSGRTAKTSAPKNAQESAIHADAKARGKSAVIVTAQPKYRADRSGGVTHHTVGGRTTASHHVDPSGKHVVTVHHDDGTHSVYRHKSKSEAKKHLERVVGESIRKGTTRHAVVGGDFSKFDHRQHGIGGEHHKVTARVLGDGVSRVNVRSAPRDNVPGSRFRPKH